MVGLEGGGSTMSEIKSQRAKVNYSLGCKISHPCRGSDLVEQWRVTHLLDTGSAVVVSGSDLLKWQRATHMLDTGANHCREWV